MPKYSVSGTVVGGKYLGVFEAATEEEAEKMALDKNGNTAHSENYLKTGTP